MNPRLRLVIIMLLLAVASPVFAQRGGDSRGGDSLGVPGPRPQEEPRDLDIFSIGGEIVPSPLGGSFLDEYRRLGTTRSTLPAYLRLAATLRFTGPGSLRIVGSLAYGGFSFSDVYSVVDSSLGPSYGSFVDEVTVGLVSGMVGIEYIPISTQFTTYVGLMGGGAIGSASWTTRTDRASAGELYRPVGNSDGAVAAPAGRLYVGVDYRFDQAIRSAGALRGIFVEAGYLVLPLRRDYFATIRRQGRGIVDPPSSDEATLDLGGPTLQLGVNFQFRRN